MNTLVNQFNACYGMPYEYASFAPGRVNLIGEHTDYTGGLVFPVALNIGTYVLAKKRPDCTFRFFSMNFEERGFIEVHMDQLTFDQKHDWANYPKGVIDTLLKEGAVLEFGLDLMFFGNIPNGAGLSSSASIELATAVLVNHVYGLQRSMLALVKLSKATENHYIGVNCGIMDQFVIGMGKKEHALLLNTHDLSFEQVPLSLGENRLIVINSMVKRALSDSKYNERISDAKQADALLRASGVPYIGALDVDDLPEVEKTLNQDVLYRKIKHIITENARTRKASQCLISGDLSGFGQLMVESHVSLRDDFMVSVPALDILVETAMAFGAKGARMTGAGFGGCIVCVVPSQSVDAFIRQVGRTYETEMGLIPEFYVVSSDDGARMINLEEEA